MTEQMQQQFENQSDGSSGPVLRADPVLTKYFENLERALHGARPGRAHEPLTWNGDEETTVAFDSIQRALQKSIPPTRPMPPDPHSTAQAGG